MFRVKNAVDSIGCRQGDQLQRDECLNYKCARMSSIDVGRGAFVSAPSSGFELAVEMMRFGLKIST